MAIDDFKALLNSGVTLEALRKTQDSCAWLVAIADRSNDLDAQAATRWLERLGERSYFLLDHAAGQAGSLFASLSSAQVTASAKNAPT